MPKKSASTQHAWLRQRLDAFSMEHMRAGGITPDAIDYLRQYRFPFLHIANPGSPLETNDPSVAITAPNSGWFVYDEVNALSSSPGFAGFVNSLDEKEDEEDEGGESGEGVDSLSFEEPKGTIINQTVMTAFDMVTIALAKGWDAIKIVDGTDLMKWAAWAAAQEAGVKVYGFAASESDKKKYERLQGVKTEANLIRPKPGRGM